MKEKQWIVFQIVFLILMFWFISLDLTWNAMCTMSVEPALVMDITACVQAEIYEPFIYTTFALSTACLICGFLGDKKK